MASITLTGNHFRIINDPRYDDLKRNLEGRVESVTLGGSHAYGLNDKESDFDVRGFYLLTREEVLLGEDLDCIRDAPVDATFYSYPRFIYFLRKANPTSIEWLGLDDDSILYEGSMAKRVRDNADLFLTKEIGKTFGGFADQLTYILRRPLKSEEADRNYAIRKRSKGMCHLIRIYKMGTEILNGEGVHTKRSSDHNLLMSIKQGEWLDGLKPSDLFFELASSLKYDFEESWKNSELPERCDVEKIKHLQLLIAENIVFKEYTGFNLDFDIFRF